MSKQTFLFPAWSDTNQAVQLQKMARGLKFRILKVEGSYYLCSENKGADQLRGYREADLRLFVFAYRNVGFLMTRLNSETGTHPHTKIVTFSGDKNMFVMTRIFRY